MYFHIICLTSFLLQIEPIPQDKITADNLMSHMKQSEDSIMHYTPIHRYRVAQLSVGLCTWARTLRNNNGFTNSWVYQCSFLLLRFPLNINTTEHWDVDGRRAVMTFLKWMILFMIFKMTVMHLYSVHQPPSWVGIHIRIQDNTRRWNLY